jgi:ubiquinone/menaquinone biosynthesis C-methylase UbiE
MNESGKPDVDKVFAGSVPAFYDTYLVPLIFEPYATDLANRLKSRELKDVLEIAAGTGVATRAMAASLSHSVNIIATDLNQAMIDHAATLPIDRPVEWRQADATNLPFEDETFDAVVCQFGMMFMPDKPKAYSEALRVLRPGGLFLFNMWDKIRDNEFADVITTALESMFPDDPPRFLARTPHGHHDLRVIEADLLKAGFENIPRVETVAARSIADSPSIPAIAYCHGTPLRNEIEARDASSLEAATRLATEAIAERFGRGPVDGKIQAHVISVER